MKGLYVDLLQQPSETHGACPVGGGVQVDIPWGHYILPVAHLPDGWYVLEVEGQEAVVELRLDDENRFMVIELQASAGLPAYVRLGAAYYRMSVTVAARPGDYPIASARFSRLGAMRVMALLSGRFLNAIKSGLSVRRLSALIKLAFSKQTFGVRAAGAADTSGRLAWRNGNGQPISLARKCVRPRFLVLSNSQGAGVRGLADQTYDNIAENARDAHDYVVIVGAGETLLPDALDMLAIHLDQGGGPLVVMDRLVNGRPTARVAWDPILYRDGLPTPYAYQAGLPEGAVASRFDNRQQWSILSVPVAEGGDEIGKAVAPSRDADGVSRPCSIIIPTRDRADLLSACLEGLFENTHWPHEVIVVDNGSVEPETFALFEAYRPRGLKIVRADRDFNFSALCNLGAHKAAHPFLVFLNNDVVLYRPEWLAAMMDLAVLEEAGAVGARLLYADGRLQHGGVMLGLTQVCGHLWRGMPRDRQDSVPGLASNSLRSAVTAACLCVERRKFDAVGGFDEEHFPVTLNDVDLCMKLTRQGWYTIYAAGAEAYHLEGESRGSDLSDAKWARRRAELSAFVERWGRTADPWMSIAVAKSSESGRFR